MADFGRFLVDHGWAWASLAGVLLAALVFVLSVAGRDWAPILVMATVPVQRSLLIGTDGHALTWTQAAVAAFFAGAAIRFAARSLTVRIDAPAILMGTVVALYGLTISVAGDRGLWAAETYRWAIAGLFLIIARSYFSTRSASKIAMALGAAVVVGFAWAAFQVASAEGPASFVRSGLMRAHGGFGEPNPYAAFIWAVTLPLVALGRHGPRLPRQGAVDCRGSWGAWNSGLNPDAISWWHLGHCRRFGSDRRSGAAVPGYAHKVDWPGWSGSTRRRRDRDRDGGSALARITFGNDAGKLGRPGANRTLGCRRTHGRVASADRCRWGQFLVALPGRNRVLEIPNLARACAQCILADSRRGWTARNARVRLLAGSYRGVTDSADEDHRWKLAGARRCGRDDGADRPSVGGLPPRLEFGFTLRRFVGVSPSIRFQGHFIA